jgi:hypothetical protein
MGCQGKHLKLTGCWGDTPPPGGPEGAPVASQGFWEEGSILLEAQPCIPLLQSRLWICSGLLRGITQHCLCLGDLMAACDSTKGQD